MMGASYLPEVLPRPCPEASGLDLPFWEAAARERLAIQRCSDCATWRWGAEWICFRCHSTNYRYEEVDPTGLLCSWTRVWMPGLPALKDAAPYLVVLVELPQAGSVRLIGNLLDDAERDPRIGESVRAVFEHHAPEGCSPYTLVQWRAEP